LAHKGLKERSVQLGQPLQNPECKGLVDSKGLLVQQGLMHFALARKVRRATSDKPELREFKVLLAIQSLVCKDQPEKTEFREIRAIQGMMEQPLQARRAWRAMLEFRALRAIQGLQGLQVQCRACKVRRVIQGMTGIR
jgi:hypothetical protein